MNTILKIGKRNIPNALAYPKHTLRLKSQIS